MSQIVSALNEIYAQPLTDGEQRKIVFLMDQGKEFTAEIEQMSLEDVKVHTLTDRNQFKMKYLLEVEDPKSSYLIYTDLDLKMRIIG